jgi:hypothetical protein
MRRRRVDFSFTCGNETRARLVRDLMDNGCLRLELCGQGWGLRILFVVRLPASWSAVKREGSSKEWVLVIGIVCKC